MEVLSVARSALKAAGADHSMSSAGAVAKLVGQRAPSLVLDDLTFKIEWALLRNVTRDDDKMMVLDALPSAFGAVSVAQMLNAVFIKGEKKRASCCPTPLLFGWLLKASGPSRWPSFGGP